VTFGKIDDDERQRVRQQLNEYCGLDTMGWFKSSASWQSSDPVPRLLTEIPMAGTNSSAARLATTPPPRVVFNLRPEVVFSSALPMSRPV